MYIFIYIIYIYIYIIHMSVAQWLRRWIFNLGVPCLKPFGGSKVDLIFHLSEVNTMSSMDIWELSGKK